MKEKRRDGPPSSTDLKKDTMSVCDPYREVELFCEEAQVSIICRIEIQGADVWVMSAVVGTRTCGGKYLVVAYCKYYVEN